jgi:two-component system LytT family response regulator
MTAYAEYAVTGYELEVIDYLLKPVTSDQFHRSIHKFLNLPAEKLEMQ